MNLRGQATHPVVSMEMPTSTSTPYLLPQYHVPPATPPAPTSAIAFASPSPSATTRVVQPSTMRPVFVVRQDARLLPATIATAPTISVLLYRHV